MALTQPTIIPAPWATDGTYAAIPEQTSAAGRASWTAGFPPECAMPLAAGGIPPHWLDFQGVLHALSEHAVFQQSGGRYVWSADIDYPAGACVAGSDGRVYQAVQASGPGTAAGAQDPVFDSASAYWGVASTPDGSSIVTDANGRLSVANVGAAFVTASGTTDARTLSDRFADKINVKDFGAVGDGVSDDSDALYEALKVFFNNPSKYKVLDLNGYNIGMASGIKIRFGEGDFPVVQALLAVNDELCICNGMLTWLGGDAFVNQNSEYLLDIGTNTAISAEAALVDFKFFNVTFNAKNHAKNLVKVFNFYDLYFSQCTFSSFNEAVAVFLPSTDDAGVYCDDNGATFWDCRWFDQPASSGKALGTPLLSYCGDLVVSRGFAEWCGPFDFHIGSILFEGFHWSYGLNGAANLARMAIFRDPREIQILGCDMDHGTLLFTTQGHFDITKQNAKEDWKQISISNNRFTGNKLPVTRPDTTEEGIINFEVSNANTKFAGINISGNFASIFEQGVDNVADFVRVIKNTGSTLIFIRATYQYTDAWGIRPGDKDFGTAAFSVIDSKVLYLDENEVDVDTISASTFSAPSVSASTEITSPLISLSSNTAIKHVAGTGNTNSIVVQTANVDRWEFVANGVFRPATSAAYNLGGGSNLIKDIYASNTTIQTSDSRKKTSVEQPSEPLMRAWGNVGFKVFQFISSIEEKGADKARLHVGVIAQEVQEAFASEGLDASRYGLFCYDKWEDEYRDVEVVDRGTVFDSSGREVEPAQVHVEHRLVKSAGDSYGIRYGEALALECAYQRWLGEQRDARISALAERLAAIEGGSSE